MKWIAGLGNPGRKYEGTRHNVGFMAVDAMAERWGIDWKTNTRCRALIGEGRTGDGEEVVLIKPQTFMNLSGESIRAYMDYFKLSLDDLIVLYDDMDTPLGQLRLRYKGSAVDIMASSRLFSISARKNLSAFGSASPGLRKELAS